jgi:hypothetical protein
VVSRNDSKRGSEEDGRTRSGAVLVSVRMVGTDWHQRCAGRLGGPFGGVAGTGHVEHETTSQDSPVPKPTRARETAAASVLDTSRLDVRQRSRARKPHQEAHQSCRPVRRRPPWCSAHPPAVSARNSSGGLPCDLGPLGKVPLFGLASSTVRVCKTFEEWRVLAQAGR